VHKLKIAGCTLLLSKGIKLLTCRAAENKHLWEMLKMYFVVIIEAYGVTLHALSQQTTHNV
jgi:hypothetical protein